MNYTRLWLGRALTDTWAFIRNQLLCNAVLFIALAAIGYWKDPLVLKDQAAWQLWYPLLAIALIASIAFVHNLIAAPSRIHRDQELMLGRARSLEITHAHLEIACGQEPPLLSQNDIYRIAVKNSAGSAHAEEVIVRLLRVSPDAFEGWAPDLPTVLHPMRLYVDNMAKPAPEPQPSRISAGGCEYFDVLVHDRAGINFEIGRYADSGRAKLAVGYHYQLEIEATARNADRCVAYFIVDTRESDEGLELRMYRNGDSPPERGINVEGIRGRFVYEAKRIARTTERRSVIWPDGSQRMMTGADIDALPQKDRDALFESNKETHLRGWRYGVND